MRRGGLVSKRCRSCHTQAAWSARCSSRHRTCTVGWTCRGSCIPESDTTSDRKHQSASDSDITWYGHDVEHAPTARVAWHGAESPRERRPQKKRLRDRHVGRYSKSDIKKQSGFEPVRASNTGAGGYQLSPFGQHKVEFVESPYHSRNGIFFNLMCMS